MIAASVGVVGMVPKIARPEVELVEVGRATRARAVCRVAPPDGGGAGQFSPWGAWRPAVPFAAARWFDLPVPVLRRDTYQPRDPWPSSDRFAFDSSLSSTRWRSAGPQPDVRAGSRAPPAFGRLGGSPLLATAPERTRPTSCGRPLWSWPVPAPSSPVPGRDRRSPPGSAGRRSPERGGRRLRRPSAQLQRLSQYLSSENYPAIPGPIGSAMNLADGVDTLSTDGKLVGAPLPELSAAARRFLRLPSRSLLEPRRPARADRPVDS